MSRTGAIVGTFGPIRLERSLMNIEKHHLAARLKSGQTMEVVVFSKRAHLIEVVLGEGVHSVKCELTPTRNGSAYGGTFWAARSSMREVATRCRQTSIGSIRRYENPGRAETIVRSLERISPARRSRPQISRIQCQSTVNYRALMLSSAGH